MCVCVCVSVTELAIGVSPAIEPPFAGDVESDGIRWPRYLATPGPCWLSTVFICSSARGPASLIVFCLTQGGWLNLNQLQTSSCLASGNQLNPPPKLNRCLEVLLESGNRYNRASAWIFFFFFCRGVLP